MQLGGGVSQYRSTAPCKVGGTDSRKDLWREAKIVGRAPRDKKDDKDGMATMEEEKGRWNGAMVIETMKKDSSKKRRKMYILQIGQI